MFQFIITNAIPLLYAIAAMQLFMLFFMQLLYWDRLSKWTMITSFIPVIGAAIMIYEINSNK
ncbi:hypothetical protein MA9V2_128 [Chryseobacterium phage MA9V-2]|nr:hypothetical protein MA9V2_128 [Chryseobacterium phage MA9V-2]